MVVEIHGKQIRLGIEAPRGVIILREKLIKSKDDDPKKNSKGNIILDIIELSN
jgi:sRNA-binding carbon storage regulator CsrA